jgi:excisionase family DNA binding protein
VTTAAVLEDLTGAPKITSDLSLLTVEEAARRLSIGRTTCFKLIRTRALESVSVGHLRRVPADAIAEYVASLRAAHRAA